MGEVYPAHRWATSTRRRGRLAGAGAVRPDRPGGVLPREGRLDPGGEEGLPRLRRARRVPGVRAGQRRAVRHLGRAVRARASPAEEERGLAPREPPPPRVGLAAACRPLATPHAPTGPSPGAVTAVVVAHDGARWLPGLQAALAAQTRPPGPGGRGRHRRRHAPTALGPAPPTRCAAGSARTPSSALAGTTGLGAAVQAGLDARAGADATGSGCCTTTAPPSPDALAHAARRGRARPAARASPGPSCAAWSDRRLLLEVGVTIARSGRRETLLERREQDQGQHDGDRVVLAVSTAGMLVRRDVWDELGGLDPRLPLLRDDVDLGWRAKLAGHRVVVRHRRGRAPRRGGQPPPPAGHSRAAAAAPARPAARAVRAAGQPAAPAPAGRPALADPGSLLRVARLLAGKLAGARRRRDPARCSPSCSVRAGWSRPGGAAGGPAGCRARTALPLLAPRSAGVRHAMETVSLLAGTRAGDVVGGRHRAGSRLGARDRPDRRRGRGPAVGGRRPDPPAGAAALGRLLAAALLLALLAARACSATDG